jgi:hypothetical protein
MKSTDADEIARRRRGLGERGRMLKFPTVGASRACENMPRASHMAPQIGKNIACTKKITAPTRIAHQYIQPLYCFYLVTLFYLVYLLYFYLCFIYLLETLCFTTTR